MKEPARKKNSSAKPREDQSFYARKEQLSLNEEHARGHRFSRSLNNSPKSYLNDNRATNKTLIIWLLRIVVILAVVVGGWRGIKIWLWKVSAPTKEKREDWAEESVKMEKGSLENKKIVEQLPTSKSERDQYITERLFQLERAERLLESAQLMQMAKYGYGKDTIARLKKSLEIAPDSTSAQKLMMELCVQYENYPEAVSYGVRLLEQDVDQWDVKESLLLSLDKLGQIKSCLALAEQMLDENSNDLNVLQVATLNHKKAGNLKRVLELSDRMLEIREYHPVALGEKGSIYLMKEEWKNALVCYQKLVDVQPDLQSYLNLTRCYIQLNMAEDAVICMGEAASKYGNQEIYAWIQQNEDKMEPICETTEYRSFLERVKGTGISTLIDSEIKEKEKGGAATIQRLF